MKTNDCRTPYTADYGEFRCTHELLFWNIVGCEGSEVANFTLVPKLYSWCQGFHVIKAGLTASCLGITISAIIID